MSAESLYAKYIAKLAAELSEEIRNSVAHRDAIDRFGLLSASFDLTPVVHVRRNGTVGFTAIVDKSDYAAKVLELTQAGYTVGDLVPDGYVSRNSRSWDVQVSGHGHEFNLNFFSYSTTQD